MSERSTDRGANLAVDRALRPVLRERSDVRLKSMLALFALIGTSLLLMLGIAYLTFPREIQDRRFALPMPHYPAPVLQPSPRVDMSIFYAEEMRQLDSAGWMDRSAGKLHIPIDQAMRAVAAENIPGWPTGREERQ